MDIEFIEEDRNKEESGTAGEDQSRFGLMTDVGRQWRGRGRGIKPIIRRIMKFEYRYLYTSVSPMTGESFSFVMPDMTTKSLNLSLEKFSKYIGKRKAIMI